MFVILVDIDYIRVEESLVLIVFSLKSFKRLDYVQLRLQRLSFLKLLWRRLRR